MFTLDDEFALLLRLLLSIALGLLLGLNQRAIRQGPTTFSLIALTGSTSTSVFLFAGMTVAQLVQEFMFLSLVAAPISGFLLMRLVVERRTRDLELLLCVGLAAVIGITSALGSVVPAVLLTGLALLVFKFLHRISW